MAALASEDASSAEDWQIITTDKYGVQMCQQSTETQDHLFFTCKKAREIWRETLRDWDMQLQIEGLEQCLASIKNRLEPDK